MNSQISLEEPINDESRFKHLSIENDVESKEQLVATSIQRKHHMSKKTKRIIWGISAAIFVAFLTLTIVEAVKLSDARFDAKKVHLSLSSPDAELEVQGILTSGANLHGLNVGQVTCLLKDRQNRQLGQFSLTNVGQVFKGWFRSNEQETRFQSKFSANDEEMARLNDLVFDQLRKSDIEAVKGFSATCEIKTKIYIWGIPIPHTVNIGISDISDNEFVKMLFKESKDEKEIDIRNGERPFDSLRNFFVAPNLKLEDQHQHQKNIFQSLLGVDANSNHVRYTKPLPKIELPEGIEEFTIEFPEIQYKVSGGFPGSTRHWYQHFNKLVYDLSQNESFLNISLSCINTEDQSCFITSPIQEMRQELLRHNISEVKMKIESKEDNFITRFLKKSHNGLLKKTNKKQQIGEEIEVETQCVEYSVQGISYTGNSCADLNSNDVSFKIDVQYKSFDMFYLTFGTAWNNYTQSFAATSKVQIGVKNSWDLSTIFQASEDRKHGQLDFFYSELNVTKVHGQLNSDWNSSAGNFVFGYVHGHIYDYYVKDNYTTSGLFRFDSQAKTLFVTFDIANDFHNFTVIGSSHWTSESEFSKWGIDTEILINHVTKGSLIDFTLGYSHQRPFDNAFEFSINSHLDNTIAGDINTIYDEQLKISHQWNEQGQPERHDFTIFTQLSSPKGNFGYQGTADIIILPQQNKTTIHYSSTGQPEYLTQKGQAKFSWEFNPSGVYKILPLTITGVSDLYVNHKLYWNTTAEIHFTCLNLTSQSSFLHTIKIQDPQQQFLYAQTLHYYWTSPEVQYGILPLGGTLQNKLNNNGTQVFDIKTDFIVNSLDINDNSDEQSVRQQLDEIVQSIKSINHNGPGPEPIPPGPQPASSGINYITLEIEDKVSSFFQGIYYLFENYDNYSSRNTQQDLTLQWTTKKAKQVYFDLKYKSEYLYNQTFGRLFHYQLREYSTDINGVQSQSRAILFDHYYNYTNGVNINQQFEWQNVTMLVNDKMSYQNRFNTRTSQYFDQQSNLRRNTFSGNWHSQSSDTIYMDATINQLGQTNSQTNETFISVLFDDQDTISNNSGPLQPRLNIGFNMTLHTEPNKLNSVYNFRCYYQNQSFFLADLGVQGIIQNYPNSDQFYLQLLVGLQNYNNDMSVHFDWYNDLQFTNYYQSQTVIIKLEQQQSFPRSSNSGYHLISSLNLGFQQGTLNLIINELSSNFFGSLQFASQITSEKVVRRIDLTLTQSGSVLTNTVIQLYHFNGLNQYNQQDIGFQVDESGSRNQRFSLDTHVAITPYRFYNKTLIAFKFNFELFNIYNSQESQQDEQQQLAIKSENGQQNSFTFHFNFNQSSAENDINQFGQIRIYKQQQPYFSEDFSFQILKSFIQSQENSYRMLFGYQIYNPDKSVNQNFFIDYKLTNIYPSNQVILHLESQQNIHANTMFHVTFVLDYLNSLSQLNLNIQETVSQFLTQTSFSSQILGQSQIIAFQNLISLKGQVLTNGRVNLQFQNNPSAPTQYTAILQIIESGNSYNNRFYTNLKYGMFVKNNWQQFGSTLQGLITVYNSNLVNGLVSYKINKSDQSLQINIQNLNQQLVQNVFIQSQNISWNTNSGIQIGGQLQAIINQQEIFNIHADLSVNTTSRLILLHVTDFQNNQVKFSTNAVAFWHTENYFQFGIPKLEAQVNDILYVNGSAYFTANSTGRFVSLYWDNYEQGTYSTGLNAYAWSPYNSNSSENWISFVSQLYWQDESMYNYSYYAVSDNFNSNNRLFWLANSALTIKDQVKSNVTGSFDYDSQDQFCNVVVKNLGNQQSKVFYFSANTTWQGVDRPQPQYSIGSSFSLVVDNSETLYGNLIYTKQ